MSIESRIQDIANQCQAVIQDRIQAAKSAEGLLAQLEVHALTGASEGVSFLLNSLLQGLQDGKTDAQTAPGAETPAPTDAGSAASSPTAVPTDPAGG